MLHSDTPNGVLFLRVRTKGERSFLMDTDIRKKMFIKLYYSLLDWSWINEPNTLVVFIHLLLNANRKDQPYRKGIIRKGEVLASYEFLSEKTGLSVQKVRTAIKNLIETDNISKRKIGCNNVFSINCWDKMENCFVDYNNNDYDEHKNQQTYNNEKTTGNQANSKEITNIQQSLNKQITTPIYCKNEENERLKECESEKALARGKLRNVFITQSEYDSFRQEFPYDSEKIIDELSEKIATGDKKYQTGHIGHLYVFGRKYREHKTLFQENKPSYDIELALRKARNRDPTKTKRSR